MMDWNLFQKFWKEVVSSSRGRHGPFPRRSALSVGNQPYGSAEQLFISQTTGMYSILVKFKKKKSKKRKNWFFGGDGEGEFLERKLQARLFLAPRTTPYGREILLCTAPRDIIHIDSKMNGTPHSCAMSQPLW